jgi:hypothetical protein
MESASESDPELPDAESVNHKTPSVSAKTEPGSGTGIIPKEIDSGKTTRVGSKRYHEMIDEPKEALSSPETSNMIKEAGPASAQEENLERRFILPDRISNNPNEMRLEAQASEQRESTPTARGEDSLHRLSFESKDLPWLNPIASAKKGKSQISGQNEEVDRRDPKKSTIYRHEIINR